MTARLCSVESCDRPHKASGLCGMHWQRQSKHGTTDLQPRRTPAEERFWVKVSPTGFCWDWTGARDDAGYGVFNMGDNLDRSHRVSYEMLIGPIPDGLVIDHLCRNRGCCNPDHLEPVTQAENSRRGFAPTVRASLAGECFRGHPLDVAYVRADTGGRMCRECASARKRGDHADPAKAR